MKINAVRCTGCGEVLVSLTRHDFASCQCGSYIDGGNDYCRIGVAQGSELFHLSADEVKYLLRLWGRSDRLSRLARGDETFLPVGLDPDVE